MCHGLLRLLSVLGSSLKDERGKREAAAFQRLYTVQNQCFTSVHGDHSDVVSCFFLKSRMWPPSTLLHANCACAAEDCVRRRTKGGQHSGVHPLITTLYNIKRIFVAESRVLLNLRIMIAVVTKASMMSTATLVMQPHRLLTQSGRKVKLKRGSY